MSYFCTKRQFLRASYFFIIIYVLVPVTSDAQDLPLFGNEELLEMVDRGGDLVYHGKHDSALVVIDSIEAVLPNHPIAPMMRAMNIAWKDQPMRISRPLFPDHLRELEKTLAMSEKILEKNENDLEAQFFKMTVHGLMAEYLATEGSYLKAMTQAQKTYNLIKLTMEEVDQSPEFYFLAGLYNYFREMYPERHPIYKPLMWFFKSGDVQRGLIQLDSAVYYSKIVKVEASLYLSYIYLRYENMPDTAEVYLRHVHDQYPSNSYFQAKLIECLVLQEKYEAALPLVQNMIDHETPYYQLCGLTYQAIYFEKVLQSGSQAEKYYEKAIAIGEEITDRGEYYRGLAYLGLGRILQGKKEYELAKNFLEKALELDESPQINAEAKMRLENIETRE